MSGDNPKLLIADHAPTRLALRIALDGLFEVCAEAGEVSEAISAAERTQPDVCIVGQEIEGGGISAVEGICSVAPNARVIVMTSSLEVGDLLAAVRAGAIGYLPGSCGPSALRRVVLAVAAGEAAVPRAMVAELARELHGAANSANGFTVREAQVLGLLREGRSTAAIAETLSISPITVRRYVSILMQKLGVGSREELAADDALVPGQAQRPSSGRESAGAHV